MPMIPLIACQSLIYDGRSLVKGDRFWARPIEAAALRYQRKADFAADFAPSVAATPVESRAYTSRDLAAEDTPKSKRTKRHYKRRDLVAEP